VNKQEAIKLLKSEGWSNADAMRALKSIDFKQDPDELKILRASSKFAGAELLNRQRLQAAQKGLVTKRNKEIQRYVTQIEEISKKITDSNEEEAAELESQIRELKNNISTLVKTNDLLKKDNRNLKNIVDEIRLKLTIEFKHLLKLENSDIKKRIVRLLKNSYKNLGWPNVISLFKKIKELKDKENIKKLSLEQLFIEADFVGNKYLSDQEVNSRNLRIAQELNDIAEIIDAQFPDTTREIIDYSK